jgi:hypothetical protein
VSGRACACTPGSTCVCGQRVDGCTDPSRAAVRGARPATVPGSEPRMGNKKRVHGTLVHVESNPQRRAADFSVADGEQKVPIAGRHGFQ